MATKKKIGRRVTVAYRLTEAQKKRAKAMAAKGQSIRAIAEKLGCAPSTAWRVTRLG